MTNNNLTAVKRLNKNGVLVTKHVRSETSTASSKSMPAPSLGKTAAKTKAPKLTKDEKRLAARIKDLDKSRTRTIKRGDTPIYANHVLRPMYKDTYKIPGTDNEFYALIERLHVDDAIVLSHHGLKPHQLDKFITGNNYQFYEKDNRDLVAQLRARGIPAKEFILAHGQFFEYGMDKVLDSAETGAIYAGSVYGDKYGAYDTLTRHVGQGAVSLEDIKNIGTEVVGNNIGSFSRVLIQLKRGNSAATSHEIKQMLERSGSDSERGVRHALLARAAVRFGVDFAENLKFKNMLFYSENAGNLPDDEAKNFISYVDAATSVEPETVWGVNAPDIDMKPYLELWRAGISPEAARDGFDRGMTSLQVIAVEKEGVVPSVSDGWL